MLQVTDISKSFGEEVLFEESSFVLGKGERLGIVGRNGSGKTTLMRLMLGREVSDTGNIRMPKNYRIGYLEQHISFTRETLLAEASLALISEEEVYKAEQILSGLGFTVKDFHRHPSEFSSGYQLRIHLAKVLIAEPDLLLLDEPTNYLDVVSIRWLERFLLRHVRELIVISHDREFMDRVTTHTMAIHRQRIYKTRGDTAKIYAFIEQQEVTYEKNIASDQKKRKETEDFINRFRSKATKAKAVQSRIKALKKQPLLSSLSGVQNLNFKFDYAKYYGRNIIEAKNLSFAYDGQDDIIKDFSLTIEKGDRIAIIGKNGRGKTTLLNLLAKELTPKEGSVRFFERTQVGYFGQRHIQRLNLSHTVEEEIAAVNPELSQGQVCGLCGLMMFSGDKLKKNIQVLSGGERSRVVLGKILASSVNILLLDEPTHHLDMESIEALVNSVKEFPGAVVIVTHDENILREIPNKLIICHQNEQKIFLDDYDNFLAKVGWGEETKKPRQPKKQVTKTIPQEVVQAKKKIKTIENLITKLEKEVESDNELLIEASVSGDGEKIKCFSQRIIANQQKIEVLFTELENLES
jgi:ATP-binding cassette, subfamily F, member 3